MEKDLDHRQPCLAFAALASSLPDGWDGAGPRWIKLAPLGRVMGRDGRGPYDFGDAAAAAAVVAASKAYLAGIDGMIDYDHAYDLGALKGVGTAPAAGWIKDLKVEPDGVYGLVEWTAKAALAIAAKEYRYISPVFLHDAMGRVSKVIRAALTAHPNFPMPALASAQNPGDDMSSLPKEVAAALGLAETADAAQAAAAVTKLKTELAAAQAGLSAAAQAVGLAAGAEPAAVCASAAALKARSDQPPDPTLYVPKPAFDEVVKALASAQGGQKQSEAAAMADKLSAEGKLAPAQRDWFLGLAAADPAAAKAYAASAPVIVPPGQTAPPQHEPGKAALTAEQKALCASMGVAEADYIKAMGTPQ